MGTVVTRYISNIDMKIFIADREKGFHTKVYIFENENDYKIIIGSSNITQSALKSNIEWNVKIVSKEEEPFIKDALREYNNLWKMSSDLNDEVLQRYMLFLNEIKRTESRKKMVFDSVLPIKPNKMQVKAMENLKRLREHGERKALVIAATGERVIIVIGCINTLISRVSGTFIKNNSCIA